MLSIGNFLKTEDLGGGGGVILSSYSTVNAVFSAQSLSMGPNCDAPILLFFPSPLLSHFTIRIGITLHNVKYVLLDSSLSKCLESCSLLPIIFQIILAA